MPWLRHANTWLPATLGTAWLFFLGLPVSSDAAPANDNFADAISLSGVTNVVGSNVGATAEAQEPAHADEPARNSVWWRWTALSNATVSISTSNSTFDTVLAVYTGTSLSNLNLVLSNDDLDFGILWSRVFFHAYAGETFYIAVAGSGGTNGMIRLNIEPLLRLMAPWEASSSQVSQMFYSSNYNGKVLLIDFWETTCGTCVDELPALIHLHQNYQDQGFSLIGLATDTDPRLVAEFLSDRNVPYPMLLNNPGPESSLAGTVGGLANPTKFLVDREGRVVARYPGANPISVYESAARALLRAPPNVRVAIERSGNSVKISWPVAETGYEVQSIGQIPGTSWTRVDAPIENLNGRNVVTVPVGADTQFFRLQKL